MNEEQVKKLVSTALNEFTLQLSEHLSQTVAGSVKLAVQEKVNGKIDRMSQKFDDYVKADNEWKVESEDMREWFKNYTRGKQMVMNSTKFLVTIGGAIITVGTVWVLFKDFIIQQFK